MLIITVLKILATGGIYASVLGLLITVYVAIADRVLGKKDKHLVIKFVGLIILMIACVTFLFVY